MTWSMLGTNAPHALGLWLSDSTISCNGNAFVHLENRLRTQIQWINQGLNQGFFRFSQCPMTSALALTHMQVYQCIRTDICRYVLHTRMQHSHTPHPYIHIHVQRADTNMRLHTFNPLARCRAQRVSQPRGSEPCWGIRSVRVSQSRGSDSCLGNRSVCAFRIHEALIHAWEVDV